MARSLILKYRLDLTGKDPANLILNQPIDLLPAKNRVAIPTYGPFYTEGLVIRERATQRVLEPDVHYKAVNLHEEATLLSGMEACTFVVVTDPEVHSELEMDYQIVGGSFIVPVDAIIKLIEDLDLDNRPVKWGDIYGKPEKYNPTKHLHDAGDLYGFEYVTAALERIRDAILIGDAAAHEEILDYVDKQDGILNDLIKDLEIRFDQHRTDYENPHNTTKAHVGLGIVENYKPASQVEAEAGVLNNRYMTPLRVAQAVTFQVGNKLDGHMANRENPHAVTKAQVGLDMVENFRPADEWEGVVGDREDLYMTPFSTMRAIYEQAITILERHAIRQDNPHLVTQVQVGLGLVQNFSMASSTEAEEGTRQDAYMSPWLVARAIAVQAGDIVSSHVSDISNPHQVTKGQVGLGSVQNFGIATFDEAVEGTVSNKYMTPLRVSQHVYDSVVVPLNAHLGDKLNPHAVTKAQVGLGSVANYRVATETEAIGGLSNAHYMTPLRVREVVDQFAVEPINNHVSRVDNPHAVTKVQVGLGNVPNYVIASEAEAIGGTANNRFMTPLRTKQAILQFAPAEDLSDILRRLTELETIIEQGKTTSTTWTTSWTVPQSSSWVTNWTSIWNTTVNTTHSWVGTRVTNSSWNSVAYYDKQTSSSWNTNVINYITLSTRYTTRWTTSRSWTTSWYTISYVPVYGGGTKPQTNWYSRTTSSSWTASRATVSRWVGPNTTVRQTSSSWTTRWNTTIQRNTSWNTDVTYTTDTSTTFAISAPMSRVTVSNWTINTSRVTTSSWTTSWT